MTTKRRYSFVLAPLTLLTIPLIAMAFTDEVRWTFSDFVIAFLFLLAGGFMGEFVLRKMKNKPLRIVVFIAMLCLMCLIWAELAVGIFGTPFAGS